MGKSFSSYICTTIVSAVMLFLTSISQAANMSLYEWLPGSTQAPLILPVRDSETPKQAAERYLRGLTKNSDLMELFQGRLPVLDLAGFRPLNPSTREVRALLIANLPKDYTRDSLRVTNFKAIFKKGGQQSYILPMNANLGLTATETSELFKLISNEFPFLVAMGGDDVDTNLYKKENLHSRNIIPVRDHFEVQLIKSYVAEQKGFLLGVCRGSQLTAVALGYTLIQDLPFHVGEKVAHANDWHEIKVHQTKYNILGSLLTKGTSKFQVNSLHHQSVVYKEGGLLQIAATAPDGVTEATEFKNGRGLLLQFHPELMDNSLGEKILWQVLKQKKRVMPASCGKIF